MNQVRKVNAMEIFYERGCKLFFKKHKNEQKLIKKLIEQAIVKELATGMSKVKVAAPTRIEGKASYEFRLNLKTAGSARIAFAVKNEQVLVLLITSNLQKDSFSRELETSLKGSNYTFNSRSTTPE